jgi:type I restriction enzyme S subunit
VSEWVRTPFVDVLVNGDISYGIVQPGLPVEIGVPVVRVNNIKTGQINSNEVMCVSPEATRKYKRTELQGGELLITVVGIIGQCAIVPPTMKGWNVARAVSVAKIKTEYDIRFIKYCFEMDDVKFQIYANTNDTVQPTLNLTQLKTLVINCPEKTEQVNIADVLASLDDKIDLLTRQNSTLETLAQTYFQQWFVESPNEAWEEKGLDGIADFLNGLALQKYPYEKGKPQYVIKIKELNNGYSDSTDLCSTDVPEKYVVHAGDVIFSWSGSLTVDIWKYESGALNQHLFKVTSDKYPKWFYYYWVKHHLPEFKIIAESKATTMGHIQRGHLTAAKVLVPSDDEIKDMDKTMSPLIEKIERNNTQILTLQKLRDTLLPKLISGEVRVKQ